MNAEPRLRAQALCSGLSSVITVIEYHDRKQHFKERVLLTTLWSHSIMEVNQGRNWHRS